MWSPHHAALAKGRTQKRHVPPWRFPFVGNASRRDNRGRAAGTASGFAENPLNLAGGNSADLRRLGNRHAVLYPRPDAGELRARNLAHRLRLGDGRHFALLVTDRCGRREHRQHPRFADRPVGRRQRFRNCCRADRRWFRGEQGLGRLARPDDLLAIIAARLYLLLSAKQDLLRNGDPNSAMSRTNSRISARTWEAMSRAASAKTEPPLSSKTA